MATVKWIKLCTDVFDDEKIVLIENMPEADAIIVIWFKLLCMAGKQNNGGVFMLNEKIAYTDEMLATIFRRPLNTVRLALSTFEQFGMIEVVNNAYTIPNWEKHQSLDKLEQAKEKTRQRVARHREKQKEMLLGTGTEDKICVYCGEKGDTIDHIIPKTKGGLDIKENVVPCCKHCNLQKNDRDLDKFLNDRLVMNEKVDISGIQSNEILKQFVYFDYTSNRFVTICNDTDRYAVTECNADRIEEDKDKDKEEDKEYNKPQAAKPSRHKYGEYQNVLLSDEDMEKLKSEFPSDYQERIERLSGYIASTGKSYKNHLATIRNWARKDNAKPIKNDKFCEEPDFDWSFMNK